MMFQSRKFQNPFPPSEIITPDPKSVSEITALGYSKKSLLIWNGLFKKDKAEHHQEYHWGLERLGKSQSNDVSLLLNTLRCNKVEPWTQHGIFQVLRDFFLTTELTASVFWQSILKQIKWVKWFFCNSSWCMPTCYTSYYFLRHNMWGHKVVAMKSNQHKIKHFAIFLFNLI